MFINFSEVQEYKDNPRYITKEAYANLSELTKELGDLSGIVIDEVSNQFVGGNQRNKVLGVDRPDAEIEWAVEYEEPTAQGTVKLGYVTDSRTGERFNLRLVRWTPEQCEIANLAANYAGGQTDYDKLLGGAFSDKAFKRVFDKKRFEGLMNQGKMAAEVEEMKARIKELEEGKKKAKPNKPEFGDSNTNDEDGEDNAAPNYDLSGGVGNSQVRMVQLFLNVETQATFLNNIEEIKALFLGAGIELDNVTDVVYASIQVLSEKGKHIIQKDE